MKSIQRKKMYKCIEILVPVMENTRTLYGGNAQSPIVINDHKRKHDTTKLRYSLLTVTVVSSVILTAQCILILQHLRETIENQRLSERQS